jgi:pyruvate/2-oxoglutarate dehydrogenase complex dihydrolipoamide acyltransferase (E2) component
VTEANLTLSFDHRVLDGGAAGPAALALIASLACCKRRTQ